MIRLSDTTKTSLYGRGLNLSVLAIQLLLMTVITYVIVSTSAAIVGQAQANLHGAESVFKQVGKPYETVESELAKKGVIRLLEDVGLEPKLLIPGLVSSVNQMFALENYYVAVVWAITFCLLVIARYLLTDKNKPIPANKRSKGKEKAILKEVEQLLGVAPIIVGQHTAFQRKSFKSLFSSMPLVLSLSDFLAIRTGRSAQITYIVNHELCHKICWDVSLSYLIKLVTLFNSVTLALLCGFVTFLLFLVLILVLDFQFWWLSLIVGWLFGYGCYRILFKSYYYFSRFKEHLADEYALLKTRSMVAAEQAINNLGNKSPLHPAPAHRMNYLKSGVSNYPLRLFLFLNLLWLLGFVIPTPSNFDRFVLNPWAELAFMTLNLPLILFILSKKTPQVSWGLSLFGIALLMIQIVPTAALQYILASNQSTSVQSFWHYIGTSLSWYHAWFALTLLLAQWPRKIT